MTEFDSEQDSKIEADDAKTPPFPTGRFWVWMAALVAILSVNVMAGRMPEKGYSPGPRTPEMISGDAAVRLSYAVGMLEGGLGQNALKKAARQRSLALASYRRMARKDRSPYAFRRLLIIEPQSAKSRVIDQLARTVKELPSKSKTRAALNREVEMWRSIYLSDEAPSSRQVAGYASMIRGLKLGWYQHLALADLYRWGDMVKEAQRERRTATRMANVFMGRMIAFTMLALGFVALGLGSLAWFGVVKLGRKRLEGAVWPGSVLTPHADVLVECLVAFLVLLDGIPLVVALAMRELAGKAYAHAVVDRWEFTLGTYLVSTGLAFWYMWARLRQSGVALRDIGLRTSDVYRDIRWGIAGYAACLPLMAITVYAFRFLDKYMRTPPNPVMPRIAQAGSVGELVALFFMVAIAAPFFEEVFFRGLLFNGLRGAWRLPAAVVVAAAIFGLVHPLPLNLLPIMVLGSTFSILLYQRGSLLPGMVAHAVNNAAAFTMLMILRN